MGEKLGPRPPLGRPFSPSLVQTNVILGSFNFTLGEKSRMVLSRKSLPSGMDLSQNDQSEHSCLA